MNRCNCCGGEWSANGKDHPECLRKLFGTAFPPSIELTLAEVSAEAQKAAGKLSISGVQPKLSMRLERGKLVSVAMDGQYILKPQTQTFPHLPENENVCMTAASLLEVDAPPHTLIQLRDESLAYVVRRFDRAWSGEKIHCEDFSQILGQDKYDGSLEQVGKRLREISQFPALDAQYFFERVLLFFLLGNGDAHLKNFSILYNASGQGKLAPAYDIVSSKLVISSEEEFALAMNGKKNHARLGDFKAFAAYLGIAAKPLAHIFDRFRGGRTALLELVADSHLPPAFKDKLQSILEERFRRLW